MFRIFIVSLLALFSVNSMAGIPVIDSANLMQNVQEVLAWGRQFQQMTNSITELEQHTNQLQTQINSTTGIRNLGNIANNPLIRNVVPGDALDVMTTISSTGVGLTNAAQVIRNNNMIYNCSGRTGKNWQICQASLSTNAQQLAYVKQAIDTVTARVSQIQTIQNRINSTTDQKQIQELQARLQAETAQVANDSNRIAILKQSAEASQRAIDQQQKELTLARLARSGDGFGSGFTLHIGAP